MNNVNQSQALAIGQCTQALNNRLFQFNGPITVRFYNKITTIINTAKRWELTQAVQKVKSFFLARCHQNSDKVIENGTKNLNQVNKIFTKIVKVSSKVSTENALYKWIPDCFLLRTGRIFGHIRKALAELANYARSSDLQRISSSRLQVDSCIRSYTNKPIKVAMIKTVSVRNIFFINYLTGLFSFSRQASLTHALKLPLPAAKSICASKSSSKRIIFIVLFERLNDFFSFLSCIGKYHYGRLYVTGKYHDKHKSVKKQSPEVLPTLSRDLTQPLNEVMIMADRYDSAHLRAEQSKLFKFYDLSTAQVVQSIASTEPQARKQLGKQSLIFVARIRLYSLVDHFATLGGYSHG